MISPINILIAILWLITTGLNYVDFCYVWQLKEYRWDRFRDFLSTEQGKNYVIKHPLLWVSFLAVIIFFWPINDTLIIKYFLIQLYLLNLVYYFYLLLRHKLRIPVLTAKAFLIVFSSLFLEAIIFLYTHDWVLLLLLFCIRFLIIVFIISLLNLFTKLLKKFFIIKAAKKISRYPNLIVIGITGSYGKTTVKTFLDQVLSSKFKTLKTPKNINTEIGVSRFILKSNFENIEVFIVEMGAYNIGEIEEICGMVKPKIGILTAINEQHLSLFGSLKATQKAKYELLRSLPKNGLAVVNSDSDLCMEFVKDLQCEVQTFGADSDNKPTFLIQNVHSTEKGIICTGVINNIVGEVEVPVIGEHNFMNIAPCFLVGIYLGLKREEVREQVRNLELPEGLLSIFKYGSATIINDSYNSNPEGFRAALSVMNKFPSKNKRVVITRGMLELGDKTEELHQKLGEEISLVADELVVITKDFIEPLTKGIGEKFRTKVISKFEVNELLSYLKELKDTDAIILLENRQPIDIYKEIYNK